MNTTATTSSVEARLDQGELAWVSREVHNHAIIVRVSGEVDHTSHGLVDHQLAVAEALVVPPAPVVLDLTSTTFFDPAGLVLVDEHAARCAELGSRLCVVANHRPVLHPLRHVDATVDVAPTVDEALAPRGGPSDRKAADGHARERHGLRGH